MIYQIEGDKMFFALNRSLLIDISVNDTLQIKGVPGASHVWTEHDSQFIESNPDDDIFLQIEKIGGGNYKARVVSLDK
jgi:hypothetical protein